MLFDNRIDKNLKDLYNGGKVNGAIKEAIQFNNAKVIKEQVSINGLPLFYTGNRDAMSVIVMLNPGQDAHIADSYNYRRLELCKFMVNTKTESDFISSYKNGCTRYGDLAPITTDEFDLKQAAFFKNWSRSGISIPKMFPYDKSTYAIAGREVLLNKLQLELIPYCSQKFEVIKQNKKDLYPYLDTILEEIISKDREYVVFASKVFDDLFHDTKMMKLINTSVTYLGTYKRKLIKSNGSHTSITFKCSKIDIDYNNIKFEAMTAQTFPIRINKAYDLMIQYGDFCYSMY